MGKLAWMGLLVALAAMGCNRDPGPREQVHGHVYYQGQLLPGGTIVFTPDPGRTGKGPLARSAVLPDGSYDLGSGPDHGAIAGWHRVTILPSASFNGALAFPLPAKYADPEQSGQICEVKGGQANSIDFHLQ